MAKSTCVRPGCTTSARTRGMCNRHYIAWRKSGEPAPEVRDETCAECGGAFAPKRAGQKYCGKRCSRNASRRDNARHCGLDGCSRAHCAKGLCAQHYNAKYFPDSRKRWPDDPEKRRARLRVKTQLRRARTRDPEAEPIDRDEIGERDGWRCGLCGRRVDKALPYPHPLSPSLDHIEPLSLGGKHVRGNVQISHLRCNVAKNNRGGGEQLLLIG